MAPLASLEESVVAYMAASRGAQLHARWDMEHITPNYTKVQGLVSLRLAVTIGPYRSRPSTYLSYLAYVPPPSTPFASA